MSATEEDSVSEQSTKHSKTDADTEDPKDTAPEVDKEPEESLETQLEAPPPSLEDPTTKTEETEQVEQAPQEVAEEDVIPESPEPPEAPTIDPDVPSEDEVPETAENESFEDKSSSKQEIVQEPVTEIPQDAQEQETKPANDSTKLASELLYNMIEDTIKQEPKEAKEPKAIADDLYIELSEHDQLTAFIEATLGALADDIEMGERQYVSHDEAYYWMTYFFLQFCGFRIFLANIDDAIAHGQSVSEIAQIVVELVDNVAENADYLHSDSDLPEHVAKNIIWQMLNSNMMLRRYNDQGVAYWRAGDILDEILERIPAPEPEHLLKATSEVSVKGTILLERKPVEEPEVCREYAGIFNVADFFVSGLINHSTEIALQSRKITKQEDRLAPCMIKKSTLKRTTMLRPVVYPSIESFTVKVGKHIIAVIITKWKIKNFEEDWAFSVKFLMGQSDACSDFYIYEAVFGLPTNLYPVPQATCSLLFTIEVSRVKPPVCSVNVSYKIEGSDLVLVPEEYALNEQSLLNIIYGKLRLFSRVRF